MEFTRLADVEVVETANDTDKVLIEQNGEIKRVPKTEVGGSGADNILVFDLVTDINLGSISGSTNMSIDDAISAITNRKLISVVLYVDVQGTTVFDTPFCMDYSTHAGAACIVVTTKNGEISFTWTADGFTVVELGDINL